MKHVSLICCLILSAGAGSAGEVHLPRPMFTGTSDDFLQYDDGSAYWLTWSGQYRGVWFHLEDFLPGGSIGICGIQYWFYHHASYPWDTASFMSELYQGTSEAPSILLYEESVTAIHYTPCFADPDDVWVYQDCWILEDTEMSSGGWPSMLGDNSPQVVSHSFFSDDFIVWEPWIISGSTANDLLVRATAGLGLASMTWGAVKAIYGE